MRQYHSQPLCNETPSSTPPICLDTTSAYGGCNADMAKTEYMMLHQ
jgi:hypothetical protein